MLIRHLKPSGGKSGMIACLISAYIWCKHFFSPHCPTTANFRVTPRAESHFSPWLYSFICLVQRQSPLSKIQATANRVVLLPPQRIGWISLDQLLAIFSNILQPIPAEIRQYQSISNSTVTLLIATINYMFINCETCYTVVAVCISSCSFICMLCVTFSLQPVCVRGPIAL